MRILDRYTLKPMLFIFTTTVLIFCLLYVLIDSASNLDEYIDQSVGLDVLVQYYINYLPVILSQTAPIACLIAVLFTFSALNGSNEIIVLRTSGLNFWQMTRMALCFALIVSAVIFYLNERYVPQAEAESRRIKNEHMKSEKKGKNKKKDVIKNLTFYGLKSRLYFIDTFDPNTYEITGITIISYDENQNIKEKIMALQGVWTGIAWKFYQCHISTYGESVNSSTKVKIYPEKLIDIKETPEDFLKQRLNVNAMNIRQLEEYIQRFANSGAKRAVNNLKVDLYQKVAFPFATTVIVLMGLPLAMITGRRKAQTFSSLGIAVGIGFLFYVCNAVGLALGKGAVLPPLLSAMMAPIIFTGVALGLITHKFS